MISYFTGFTKIISRPITLHKSILDKDIRLTYGDNRKLVIIDINDIPQEHRNNIYLNFYNIPKTEYADSKLYFNYYYGNHYIYPYINEVSIEEMREESVRCIARMNYFIHKDRWSRNKILFAKLEKEIVNDVENIYNICYYIKNDIIETCKNEILNNDQILSRSSYLLTELLISQKHTDIIRKNDNLVSNIESFDEKESFDINAYKDLFNNNLLKEGITLYNYQKGDIIWMGSIESNIDNNCNIITYEYCEEYKVLDDFYLYDGLRNHLHDGLRNHLHDISSSKRFNENSLRSFKYYGGNIISEVGLGKTIIALYYILQNDIDILSENSKFVRFGDSCNYFYKRGKSRGTCCTKIKCDNSLYCKSHMNTPFIDKRNLIVQNVNQFYFDDRIMFIAEEPYIKTNATLIVCKAQLCDQWVQEYYDKFNNTHKILLIVTYDQYTNITLADLLFSDIIIVSYEFLSNKKYVAGLPNVSNLLHSYLKSYDPNDNEKLLHTKVFNYFSLFYWRRIVYDEAHEKHTSVKTVYKFQSKYKWNITGTPFVNKSNSFIKLMSYNTNYTNNLFIENLITNEVVNMSSVSTSLLIKLGLDNDVISKTKFLFRRNTKNSVILEYDKNVINEFTNLLEFTSQERSIYDSYVSGAKGNYINFLIRLCCHPELNEDTREMIKNCKTFDEIHNCLLHHNKRQKDFEEKRIEILEKEIKSSESALECVIHEDDKETIRLEIHTLKRKLTISKKTYESISRTYNYLKSSLDNLQTSEMCPICLDDITDIAITKCGHKFCWDCLYQTHKAKEYSSHTTSSIKCPSCNTLMSPKDIYLLHESKHVKNTSSNELSVIIQNVKSTKIGNIIYFLKKELENNNKVILFSQWDELLHKVGNLLLNEKIKLVYCNGSVYQRKRAISSFYNDSDTNLILLSSKNSASGINLTIANKIIFLEPIYGNKEYRKNIECQAIGRADRLGQKRPIDIHRFIIKDTIEEDIYNNYIDDSKIKNI